MPEIDNLVNDLDCNSMLKDFLKSHLQEIEQLDKDIYNKAINGLKDTTKPINIENSEQLDKFLAKLHHSFVEEKGLWDVSDTSKIANSLGINFNETWFNEYSFNYVMNMTRADYYEAFSKFSNEYPSTKQYILDNPKLYAYLAEAWLSDVDAPKTKLMLYLHNIVEH